MLKADNPSRLKITREKPLVMGILNVTPDSFSDAGSFFDTPCALRRALQMMDEGADIIDVGPESTRPGATPVETDEQIRRAVGVIEVLRSHDKNIAVSIDTRDAEVARVALESGADIVNDVSALRGDARMAGVVSRSGAWVVLMHMRGQPETMQRGGGPRYDDVVAEVCTFLRERRDFAVGAGIPRDRIILDPGIGFGKRVEHNWALLGAVDRIVSIGQPVLIGASRKRFLATTGKGNDPKSRLVGSIACAVVAATKGASVLRVHDVAETVEALGVVQEIDGIDLATDKDECCNASQVF